MSSDKSTKGNTRSHGVKTNRCSLSTAAIKVTPNAAKTTSKATKTTPSITKTMPTTTKPKASETKPTPNTTKMTLSTTKPTPSTTKTTPSATKLTPNTTKITPRTTETYLADTNKTEGTQDKSASLEKVGTAKETTVTEDVKENPKILTRLEKAQLEAIESFKGQHLDEICKESKKIVAKYFKPKKTNSQDKQATPLKLSLRNRTGDKANIDVFSCLHGDENFNDHTVLLETSKRVVETAISLETPEGSPACH